MTENEFANKLKTIKIGSQPIEQKKMINFQFLNRETIFDNFKGRKEEQVKPVNRNASCGVFTCRTHNKKPVQS